MVSWAKATADYPFLSNVLNFAYRTEGNSTYNDMSEGMDAMWRIGQEAMNMVIWDVPNPAVDAAFAQPVANTTACEMLRGMDYSLKQLMSALTESSSILDVRYAFGSFKRAQPTFSHLPNATAVLPCLSPSGQSRDASLAHLVSQFRALPLCRNFLDHPEIWADLAMRNVKKMIAIPEPYANVFQNVLSNRNTNTSDERGIFLELATTTTTMPSANAPGTSNIGAFATISVVLMVVGTAFLLVQFYMLYIRDYSFFARSFGLAGTVDMSMLRGYTMDGFVLTLGCCMMLLFILSIAITFIYGRATHKGSKVFLRALAAHLKTLTQQKRRVKHVTTLERALENGKLSVIDENIRVVCEFERLVVSACEIKKLYDAHNTKDLTALLEKLKAGESLLDITSQRTEDSSVIHSHEEIEEMNMFHRFFETTHDTVPGQVVLAKLIELGLPDTTANQMLNTMDNDNNGQVSFREFSSNALHSTPPSVVGYARQLNHIPAAVLLALIAMTLIFTTGDTYQGLVSLMGLLALAVGFVASIVSASRVRSIDPASRLLREKKVVVSMQSVTAAFGFIGFFFVVYSCFLRACDDPVVECPNVSSSFSSDPTLDQLREQNRKDCEARITANGTLTEIKHFASYQCQSEYSIVQPMCLDDLDSSGPGQEMQQCRFNVRCSRDSNPYWMIPQTPESFTGTIKKFAFVWFNKVLRDSDELPNNEPIQDSDFPNTDYAIAEITRRRIPPATMLCIEQSTPPNMNLTRIARGRSGYVEDLLDFGLIKVTKEVAFVPWGQPCDDSLPATTVRPFPVSSDLDLAYHTYGPSQFRFQTTIPGRTIGQSYYSMCEREVKATSFTKITDAVYVFGEAAGCGSPGCAHSDFTPKMSDSWVSRFYFTIVTASTIGYGDISPASSRGRLAVVMHAIFQMMVQTLSL